ncbi:hypothetical protein M3Y98_00640900 [Aphelenchoides besseyi]|nr:hypothetical protein M3Y98_00640900 [Aphelenchoides besseyi]KAI6208569.1 hypothetical protein M3Y96_00129000 [Aphelenchoides besseyi]
MGLIGWLAKSGLKIAAVAGAVKISMDNNVWSLNTNESGHVYEKFKKDVVNGTIVYKEKMPTCDEMQTNVGQNWNNGINQIFNYLNNAPTTIKETVNGWYKTGMEAVKQQ